MMVEEDDWEVCSGDLGGRVREMCEPRGFLDTANLGDHGDWKG